ncbi:uncharacterized protein LOC107610814 [Arachis ipaensis]|uniref:uncharacterized protein LOC107610814 n=1 Tax=Arachis ipaensis TaxID=130454 RepID=UPI0007AF3776|nr:uncharacterized protein LOC107610814 [Arachis ipaensis]
MTSTRRLHDYSSPILTDQKGLRGSHPAILFITDVYRMQAKELDDFHQETSYTSEHPGKNIWRPPGAEDDPALDWFCSLPADSISRFQELAKQFEDHFAASAIYLHDFDYLNTIKQGKFQEAIAVAKPKTLAEFREKAKGQIDIEELHQARKAEKTSNAKDDDKPRDNKKTFKPVPRYNSYTQFNTKRNDIIKEILSAKLIKPPRKAGNYPKPKNIEKSKYCTFHQKHGHTTDKCVITKDLLERLARQGHLDKYIAGHMQKRAVPSNDTSLVGTSSREKDKAPVPPRGVINCISGGYVGGDHTSSARKCTYRTMLTARHITNEQPRTATIPEMTFHPSNFNSNYINLDDPVVISIQLGDLIVRKVLLNPGNSSDVLFFSTFEKMKLSNNILQPSVGDLVGFSGEQVPVLGSVWLHTTLGEHPLSKTQDIQYLVVDNLVATIHGDHREVRLCYNTSFKPPRSRREETQVNVVQSKQPILY